MLSILIPTYNYDCYRLVAGLQQQAAALDTAYEVIVADDASREALKTGNRRIGRLPGCRYIELENNIGRACIRNFLAEQARGKYLLFIDSDAGIRDDGFLRNYLQASGEGKVVCGGLLHPLSMPSAGVSLRYTYEKMADKYRMASLRQQNPYDKFTTFSFLIPRSTFLEIKFDCTFVKYGHEDTLFGCELKKREIPVVHIDNPLYHLGLEDNETFLKKTESGIRNLSIGKEKLEGHSRLYALYSKICSKGFRKTLLASYRLTYRLLRKNLLGKHPDMRLFAFYKLGYLCAFEDRRRKGE